MMFEWQCHLKLLSLKIPGASKMSQWVKTLTSSPELNSETHTIDGVNQLLHAIIHVHIHVQIYTHAHTVNKSNKNI